MWEFASTLLRQDWGGWAQRWLGWEDWEMTGLERLLPEAWLCGMAGLGKLGWEGRVLGRQGWVSGEWLGELAEEWDEAGLL